MAYVRAQAGGLRACCAKSDVADTGAMWECPLLAPLPIVPEHLRPQPMYGGLSGLKTLSNSFASSVAFSPAQPAATRPRRQPTARRARAAAARCPPRQNAPRPQSAPQQRQRRRRLGFLRIRRSSRRQRAQRRRWRARGTRRLAGGDGLGGGGEIDAKRAKSLLSEQLLNPYADEADNSVNGDATMCALICLWCQGLSCPLLSLRPSQGAFQSK